MDTSKFDEIGYWSEIKLDIIREYAVAYSKILSAQTNPSFYHIYIDTFSGAGINISRNSGDFVLGSPLNALSVEPPFREYHLIDIKKEKIESLDQLIGDRKNVFLYQGDCNKIMQEEIIPNVSFGDYRHRPKEVAGFKYVPEPIAMKNSQNAIIYYLFFASPKPVAANIVKSIFDKYKKRAI